MSGLTANGFQRKTFEEIKNDIETVLIDNFGIINLNDESVFSQIIGIFAERETLLWEGLESVYNSFYPDTATDFSLDGVCQLIGLTRLEATPTTVVALLYGINQTTIFRNSEATAVGVNTIFRLTGNVLLTNDNCYGVEISIIDISPGAFSIILNGVNISYTKDIDDTKTIILNELVDLINNSNVGVVAINYNDTLIIRSNTDDNIIVYIDESMIFDLIINRGNFEAIDKGFIPLPAESLTIIQTPTAGWLKIKNSDAGLTGRNLETDKEFRIRRTLSLRLAGAGTVEAIRAQLLNIVGVTAVNIVENITNIEVDGIPPHSFESLILGGSDIDIGNILWKTKPAGIRSYGNTSVLIHDSTGRSQVVSFSRPISLYIYVTITITLDMTDFYPLNGNDVIKNGIVDQIKMLNVGDDVIYQSFYQSIYKVIGIESAIIEIGGTLIENNVPFLFSSNIEVESSQIAVSDLSKINIIIV
jgi:uncharacterized phage protein gp47/JayE